MKKRAIAMSFLLLLLAVVPVMAKKQTVGPQRLKKTQKVEAVYDTIPPSQGDIVCSGYDKPNRATRETFFLTNNTSDTIDGVGLTFTYLDMQGRLLHSADHTLRLTLPPGQTRNVSVSSWDRNNAFHYELSPAPPRRRSTPYRVRSRINFLLKRM